MARVVAGGEHRRVVGARRFYRNYNRILALACALLLLALAAFFGWQLKQQFAQELRTIEGQLARHHQLLEFALRSSADQVESLRMAAGRPVALAASAARSCPDRRALTTLGHVRETPRGFDRDALPEPDSGGNLLGAGPLAGRSPDFYCDLGAALALDGQLRAVAFHLPHAAHVRFLSAQGFEMVAPWRPAREMPPTATMKSDPVWRLGQPAADPERLKYWAPVYFGGEALGLLAPVAAPVYDRNRFMGVIALDMSLDYLHRLNAGFGYPLGSVAVVDGQGRVLAHPSLYAHALAVRAPAGLAQVFPPALLPSMPALRALPDGQARALGEWVVIRRGFVAAPWQLVYVAPRADLWWRLLSAQGPGLLAVLAGVAMLLALTWFLTLREFVGPAAQLVRHVVAASNFRPLPTPRVPPAWRPWFEAVRDAFRKSMELGLLRQELDIAARMQQAILPRQWPQDARFSLWGATAPAKDVGGDFHDHFALEGGRCALVVADVSGKGIAAGLFAMVSKTLLRSLATHSQAGPARVLAQANQGLCADNEASMFVTCFHGQYDPASGRLAYVNAGHPRPLLAPARAACRWLEGAGTALGVVEPLEFAEHAVQLSPGDTVLMFSDGVSEALDAGREQFGLARLEALFEGRPAASAREAVERVLAAVREFAQGCEAFDDITCMALHRHGPGAAA